MTGATAISCGPLETNVYYALEYGMASLDVVISAWEEAHWEFSLAFEGLPDEDVWKRPHPNLLSIGELAGHVAFWEAVRFVGPGQTNQPDMEMIGIKSPLINRAFRYYSSSIDQPVELGLTAAEVLAEFNRIHQVCKETIAAVAHDSEDPIPGHPKATWGSTMKYQVFHVAYHTGQAYSVRHLLGQTTTDN